MLKDKFMTAHVPVINASFCLSTLHWECEFTNYVASLIYDHRSPKLIS